MEVSAGQPVAGAVRLFLAFMKSFQVGYGVSMGSKLAVYLLSYMEMWNPEAAIAACPTATDLENIEW